MVSILIKCNYSPSLALHTNDLFTADRLIKTKHSVGKYGDQHY